MRIAWVVSSLTYRCAQASSQSGMCGELFQPFYVCVISRISDQFLARPSVRCLTQLGLVRLPELLCSVATESIPFTDKANRHRLSTSCSKPSGLSLAARSLVFMVCATLRELLHSWGVGRKSPRQAHQKLPLFLSEVQQLLTDKSFSIYCSHLFYFQSPEMVVSDNFVQFIVF